MALWQIAVVVLAVVAILWTVVGVPLLINLSRTTRRMDSLLREVELNLGPALAELRDTARHLNKASAGVADGVAQAGRTFEAVGEFGRTLSGANAVLRAALGPGFTAAGSFIVGVRTGLRVLLRRSLRRR